MHSPNRRMLAVALAVISVSAPSAQAGTQMTKAGVIKRGSTICRAAQRRVAATPAPRSQNPFSMSAPNGDPARAIEFMAVYAASLTSVRNGIGRLVPVAPPQGRPLLVSFVAQLGPTIAAFRAGHSAALEHHYARALTDVQRGFGLFERASVKTKAYGFPKGICQAGS